MNIQGNSVENTPFKIIFSNINCKITLSDSSFFAFVIRIGKKSSKYTQRKQIKSSFLEFDNILEVPFDQKLLTNQNARKEKCEIMLYKFKVDRQKQTKQLIGMASVAVSNEMFDEEVKKLRLTNSFDKQAYVQCVIKIQLGEADVLSQNESRMSSFYLKSNQYSINEISDSRWKETKELSNRNEAKIGLVTSNSRKSIGLTSEQMKQDNSFIQILNAHTKEIINKSPKNQSKSQTQMVSLTQPTSSSQQLISNNKQFELQRNNLMQICSNLQYQNQFLMGKIQTLQSQMLNQSFIMNKSGTDNLQVPRLAGNIKRSPMIKKNTTITVIPSFLKHQSNEQIFNVSTYEHPQLKNQNSSQFSQTSRKSQIKINGMKYMGQQQFSIQAMRLNQTDNELAEIRQLNSHMTFAGQKFIVNDKKLCISTVIGVTYTPSSYRAPRIDTSQNERQNSIINHSISDAERKNSRSYTKFTGKKKYQIIGAIKSSDQSQNISYLENQSEQNRSKKGGSFILNKPPLSIKNQQQNTFHGRNQNHSRFKTQKQQVQSPVAINQNMFLDFLNDKDQNPIIRNINDANEGVLTSQETKENIHHRRGEIGGDHRQRVTLEELDMQTQKRFRKNQRALKIANMKILEENVILKKENKSLEEKIESKKQLSYEDFSHLRNQIDTLSQQVEISNKAKTQSEYRLNQLSNKWNSLQQENIRLRKELKEQRSKFEYYLKMSNINDDKEKQHNSSAESLNALKKTFVKSHSEIHSQAESTKSGKNEANITSLLNLSNRGESNLRKNTIENKPFKKFQFTSDHKLEENKNSQINLSDTGKKNQQNFKPDIPKPASSMAVCKLKLHLKSTIQKSSMNDQRNTSSNNGTGNNQSSGFYESGLKSAFFGGFSGTGQTIVKDALKMNSSFSQK